MYMNAINVKENSYKRIEMEEITKDITSKLYELDFTKVTNNERVKAQGKTICIKTETRGYFSLSLERFPTRQDLATVRKLFVSKEDFTEKIKATDICDVKIIMSIECSICQNYYEEEVLGITSDKAVFDSFLNMLHNDGWRMTESNKHCSIGLACPDCIEDEENFRKASQT